MSTGELTTYDELADIIDALPLLVREGRRVRGLSLRAAAKEIGINFNVLYRFEQGGDIVLSNALAILRWLGPPIGSGVMKRLLWEARATRLNYERAQRAGGAR